MSDNTVYNNDLPKNVYRKLNRMTQDSPGYRNMSYSHHLTWAWNLPSPEDNPNIPDFIEEATTAFVQDPLKAVVEGEQLLDKWMQRKAELAEPWRKELDSLPPHIRDSLGESKNVLLIEELAATVKTPDRELAKDLREGMPVIGNLTHSGTTEIDA